MREEASKTRYWEQFRPDSGGAEIGLRGVGPTEDAAIEEIALALMELLVSTKRVLASAKHEIVCGPASKERLLAEFLNRILQLVDEKKTVFCFFEVTLKGQFLEASAWGEPIDQPRHRCLPPPKGALEAMAILAHDGAHVFRAECLVEP
jgi:tRNA nucleotidyltransferase (CCA-adding enzyme)